MGIKRVIPLFSLWIYWSCNMYRCYKCGKPLTKSNIAPSHLKKHWFICRICSNKAKQLWRANNRAMDRATRRRNDAKRKRELGYKELCKNPFNSDEDIEWHHINNIDVVALPIDIHRLYMKNRIYHRVCLYYIVKQIYPFIKESKFDPITLYS